jgi:hypothetical protein
VIEPWQVWPVELGPDQQFMVLVVSSPFHLRLTSGRQVSIVPLHLSGFAHLDFRVKLLSPDNIEYWVVTDQMRTIDTKHLTGDKPAWELDGADVGRVRDVLRHMVAFA